MARSKEQKKKTKKKNNDSKAVNPFAKSPTKKKRKSNDSSSCSSQKKKKRKSTPSDSSPPTKKRRLNDQKKENNSPSPTMPKKERKVFQIDPRLEEEFPPNLFKAAVNFGTTLRQRRQFDEFAVFLRRVKSVVPKELKPGQNKPAIKPIDDVCPDETPICVITDTQFCTPRGKQQLEVYKTCLAFRSQNKVNKGGEPEACVAKWKNVDRWLTLDEPGKVSHFFMKLKHPISVGKHSNQYIHFQFGYGEELELKLTKRVGKVKPTTKDIAAETLGRVVEHLSKIPLISSRQAPFSSYKVKEPFVRASFGSNMVSLYFLHLGVVIIPKPLKIIEFKDILDFDTGSGGRYINITITTSDQKTLDFGMIPKDNQNLIEQYFRQFKVSGVPEPDPKEKKGENEMDWETYQSDEDDEFDFQDALSKTDVTNDFVDGKLDLGKVASKEWRQMRDVKESGALDGEDEEYDEEMDSDFDFDDEVKKTDLKKDFVDKERSYDKMIDDKDFKKLIDRSGSGVEDEDGGEFDADDFDFMKELNKKKGSDDESEEESDPDEDVRAKRKRLRNKRMLEREEESDDDDESSGEEEEEVCEVEKILGTKGEGKKLKVHVLWEAGDKTWEPLEHVENTQPWKDFLKSQKDGGDSEATEDEDDG